MLSEPLTYDDNHIVLKNKQFFKCKKFLNLEV